jgi:3alpha(or 20beta)-hydroxysteroid dehydrogenase
VAELLTARLRGEIALVTGAARGIGASVVDRLAQEGAEVIATDVLDELGEQRTNLLARDGASVVYAHLDVREEGDWAAVIQRCHQSFGHPTILVNNAGIVRPESVTDESLQGWNAVIDVNLTGVFLGMRAVLPQMCEAKRGVIVNVSSIWGLVATEASAAYHASKGGVTVLTRNAAVTYAKQGIRINSVHPGQVRTPMTEMTGTEPFVVARTPLGRAAMPDEIASAIVWLVSSESSFVTGAELVIDGGFTAH